MPRCQSGLYPAWKPTATPCWPPLPVPSTVVSQASHCLSLHRSWGSAEWPQVPHLSGRPLTRYLMTPGLTQLLSVVISKVPNFCHVEGEHEPCRRNFCEWRETALLIHPSSQPALPQSESTDVFLAFFFFYSPTK